MKKPKKEQIMLRLHESDSDILAEMKAYMGEEISTKAIILAVGSYVDNIKTIADQREKINHLRSDLERLENIHGNFTNSLTDMLNYQGIALK